MIASWYEFLEMNLSHTQLASFSDGRGYFEYRCVPITPILGSQRQTPQAQRDCLLKCSKLSWALLFWGGYNPFLFNTLNWDISDSFCDFLIETFTLSLLTTGNVNGSLFFGQNSKDVPLSQQRRSQCSVGGWIGNKGRTAEELPTNGWHSLCHRVRNLKVWITHWPTGGNYIRDTSHLRIEIASCGQR